MDNLSYISFIAITVSLALMLPLMEKKLRRLVVFMITGIFSCLFVSELNIVKTTQGRKVYLILDNLRVHHSKAVTEWVEGHKEQISLFYLPSYSPEYNPDEYLNNDLKHNIGTQAAVSTIQELENNTNSFMKTLSDNPKHVQSYFNFNHPKLKDYKLD